MVDEALAGRLRPVARTLQLDGVATRIIAALADIGVRAVLLKGASFRDLLYGIGELRTYSDVDLLISPTHTREAGRALVALGYLDVFAGAAPSETSPFATEYRGRGAVIDVHRSLPGVTVPDEVAWDELSRRTATIVLHRTTVEVLDREARCLHVALDAAADGRAHRKGDLERAVDRLPREAWRGAAQLADRLGALPSLVAALTMVPSGEALRVALEIEARIPVGVTLRALSPPPLSVGLHRLVSTPGLRSKVAFLARRLVPTPSGLRYWSPLARRGNAGMVLAYAWRPFHLLVRGPRAALALFDAWRRGRHRPRPASEAPPR